MDGAKLKNEYVQEYYNAQVGALATSYTDDRWHSSKVQEFEYEQTRRALEKALGIDMVSRALEIGPGDGVWTSIIFSRVTEGLHLVEQSQAMLTLAKKHLAGVSGITFEHGDFLKSNPPEHNDLVVAVRCFEYFEDKPAVLKKIHNLLTKDGRVIIITKNPKLLTSVPSQSKLLHSAQVSVGEMRLLAEEAGFNVTSVYPAVLRWKATFPPMRVLFTVLHKLAVASSGALQIPFISTFATESYVYVLSKKAHV